MGKAADIFFELIGIWAKENEIYSKQATVVSVSEDQRVCIVSPVDGGPDIIDVSLEADYTPDEITDPKGFFLVPAVGSLVIVSFKNNTDAFVSAWTTIDKVIAIQTEWIFNDGNLGGLININQQAAKLNAMVTSINAELVKIATGITGAGGAYTPETIDSFNSGDFEDEDVVH